ncbi:MAG: fluoride efflux transporter FluC [Nesterenkonia sp.]
MSTSEQPSAKPWAPHSDDALSLGAMILAVALAGAVGAVLRLAIGAPFEEHYMKFPWATLMINLGGSAALGLLTGVAHSWRGLPGWAVPVLGTGLLGSFTTFSAVMLAAVASQQTQLFGEIAGDEVIPAGLWEMLAYLGMGMLFCTAAAAAGITAGRALCGYQEES